MNLYKITYNRLYTRTIAGNSQHEALARLIKLLDSLNGGKIDLYSEYKGLTINQCQRLK